MMKPLARAWIVLSLCSAANSFAAESVRVGAASAEELRSLFEQRAAVHDLAGLHALVFSGAGENDWKLFDRMIEQGFQYEIVNVEITNLEEDEVLEYTSNGVKYRPTLAPVGRLVVKYRPRGNDPDAPAGEVTVRSLETSFLVGVETGRFYITFAAPVRP
jgi:hypothetical protein